MHGSINRRMAAETIGTFGLVFAGAGAIAVDSVSGGAISHLGVALVFGLVVMTMIYALGDISGAHLNPAVTVGFWISRRLAGRDVVPYVLAQCCGALLAGAALRILLPGAEELGVTRPVAGVQAAFGFEILLTAILMFVILGVSTGAKEKGAVAGIAIGGTVAMCALFGGPISGASMNPARSIGPALVSGEISVLWIYLFAPVIGSAIAVLACRCVREGCCAGYAIRDPARDSKPLAP